MRDPKPEDFLDEAEIASVKALRDALWADIASAIDGIPEMMVQGRTVDSEASESTLTLGVTSTGEVYGGGLVCRYSFAYRIDPETT